MHYDSFNDIYTYPVNGYNFSLRNQNNEIICRNNIDSFLIKISGNDFLYDFSRITENSIFINNEDAELVNLYSGITCSLRMKSISATNFFIKELKRKYPDAYKYTDLLFLEGLKWKMLSKQDSAKIYFNKFLNTSGSKYSLRFRGYYFSDSAYIQFTNERQFARSFLRCEKKDSVSFFKNDIFPRYYYESFSQGFVLNREDFGNRKIIPGLAIEIGGKGDYLYGVGCNWLSTQNMVIGGQFSFTRYNIGAMADVPLQLYKSAENGFGIKFTPLIYYQYVRKTEPVFEINAGYFNPGAGLSVGYHFNQKVYAGASYLYFLYNQYNKVYLKNKIIDPIQQNELDISLYYQLIKGLSVKAGIVDGSPVFGLTLTGALLGYGFKTKSLSLKPEIY